MKIQVVSERLVFQKVSAISFFKKRNRVIKIIKLGEMQIAKKPCKKIENGKIFEQLSIFIHVEYVFEFVCLLHGLPLHFKRNLPYAWTNK